MLRGERVILRPFAAGDAAVIARIIEEPEVRRLTGSTHLDFGGADLERIYAERATADDRLDLAIIDRAALGNGRAEANGSAVENGSAADYGSAQPVGEVVLNEWDEHNRSCNFRILIGRGGRDRGLGTEATRLIVDHGFRVLGLHRIHLYVYTFNPRAVRVYEKAGFTAEGVDREVLWHDGGWVDAVRMSMLEHEWR